VRITVLPGCRFSGHCSLVRSRHYQQKPKILFLNGDLTLALAGRWRPLRAGTGRGGSGRAPGWCGWAVSSLLLRSCGGDIIIISILPHHRPTHQQDPRSNAGKHQRHVTVHITGIPQ
jgi:hypothetical protein